ncbi:MAG: poly-gamma-glutamate biosynthesis protein PgsC [Clostridia bacterium]|nr:poly-gamma-glutamate biosynthesis protein PgsC [Clostridia bacterium]MBR4658100.1 poly-gamma-glutamate biosynthesis protein PgsC [Clostridia bacterium]MBR6108447.1 poly-gamma-glutamate biosynthesis protein PgsC [Clostridia bacterium]
MELSYVYTTIILGIAVSLIFTELTGISAGGIVVPAYLALTVNQPSILISTVAIGILSYVAVEFGLSRLMMLYGKRKFVAFIFIALILRILLNLILGGIFDAIDALTSVGVITAALIASTISKQGVKFTLIGTVAVTAIVYVLVEVIAMI